MAKNTIYLAVFVLLGFACKSPGDEGQKKTVETDIQKQPSAEQTTKPSTSTVASTEGMVLFEGDKIKIGRDDGYPLEAPSFEVQVSSFYIDKNLVTVAQFRKFIQETGYKTDAEKFGDSGVFDIELQKWELLKGAYWEMPLGPEKEKALDDHPVTHVSWNDADAYAKWAGKRLPYEIEWEFAAKNGGKINSKYSWGKSAQENGKYMANVWQGTQTEKQGADGFVYTSPVGYFGETEAGLTDMGGNVWQWCADVFNPYSGSNQPHRPNPDIKVIRGGSFFYDEAGAESFTTTFRAQNSKETSLFNMGFRCAKDKV